MKRSILGAVLAAACAFTALAPAPACAADPVDTYTQTRYPIVLVHGLFGWDSIGPVDYWYGIPAALKSSGATVYVTQTSAANDNETRGEQLLAELRRLKAAYGYTRFNLIGHSQGGPTARYVASVAPELVASVTTVGGVHGGSPAADELLAVLAKTGTTSLGVAIFDGLGTLIGTLSGQAGLPQNSMAAARSLTIAGSASFNAKHPEGAPTTACGSGPELVNGVRYFSVAGTGVVTNLFDPSDYLLLAGSLAFKGEANDGLVGRCSAHWGTVLRDDYPWNHLDEINQFFGLRGLFSPDPVAFYRTQANRLKTAGL